MTDLRASLDLQIDEYLWTGIETIEPVSMVVGLIYGVQN